ncbi:MAG: molybdopterin-guanine dinucleotide biosynthesis protein B [Thermodesulfobacteriota bacterium]
MVPVISIVGLSGSGKTTLIEKLVCELTARGHRVGTVKHDAHAFEIDHEGKDSWRHKRAGARTVVLASKEKLAVIRDTDSEWEPARLVASFLDHLDVVVAEGFKESGFPKIEVVRAERSVEPVCSDSPLLRAVATDVEGLSPGVPVYGIDDFKGIADLVEEEVMGRHRPSGLSVTVDGRVVETDPFTEGMIREGVLGMLKTLKGCADASEVEIRIKRR